MQYNFEELVRAVADRVLIEANPQSDLSVTDTTDPAFVKGKETFKAADSAKLNGKSAEFYAKEKEIRDLTESDIITDFDTKTNI